MQATPTHRHQVRYHETDSQGFVFNARYLEIVDVAMTEFIRELGFPYDEFVEAGADPSVVRAEIDFKKPARFDDLLDLQVECLHVGRSSFRLRTTITCSGDLIAISNLVYVNVDPLTASSRPLPEAVATALGARVLVE